ncbi:MAG: hypothetical protein KGL39_45465 [Patescibacteria group bacterium]|nr:hypothetical protein [Patescibacteria group bacterium]
MPTNAECGVRSARCTSSQVTTNTSSNLTGLGVAHLAALRAYWKALRQYKFEAEPRRLADVILFYSHGFGRFRALVPKQKLFSVVTGMGESKVSEAIEWLLSRLVIERDLVRVTVRRRELRWMAYWLRPPDQWQRIERRMKETRENAEVELWLEMVDAQQPELLEPPPSLSQLLAEDFAERMALGGKSSRVEPGRGNSPAGQGSSPGGNSSGVTTVSMAVAEASFVASRCPGVPPEGTLGAGLPQKGSREVPLEGSFVSGQGARGRERAGGDRVDPDRVIESKRVTDRSGIEARALDESSLEGKKGGPGGPHGQSDYRAYVQGRLCQAIGRHELSGLSGSMWGRALDRVPEELDELISFGLEAKKLGRIKGPLAAWLNVSTRKAIQMAGVRGRLDQ